MTLSFTPYLTFPGTARDALAFYADVFGGTVESHTFADFGQAEGDAADLIMHATFTAPDFTFHASDTTEAAPVTAEGASAVTISLALMGSEPGDLKERFEQLADGGEILLPLEKQVWGDWYGETLDRFGVRWMVDFHDPAEDSAPQD